MVPQVLLQNPLDLLPLASAWHGRAPQHSSCLVCVGAIEYVVGCFECGSLGGAESELWTFADGGVWAMGGPRNWLPARAAAALIAPNDVETVGGVVAWVLP